MGEEFGQPLGDFVIKNPRFRIRSFINFTFFYYYPNSEVPEIPLLSCSISRLIKFIWWRRRDVPQLVPQNKYRYQIGQKNYIGTKLTL